MRARPSISPLSTALSTSTRVRRRFGFYGALQRLGGRTGLRTEIAPLWLLVALGIATTRTPTAAPAASAKHPAHTSKANVHAGIRDLLNAWLDHFPLVVTLDVQGLFIAVHHALTHGFRVKVTSAAATATPTAGRLRPALDGQPDQDSCHRREHRWLK